MSNSGYLKGYSPLHYIKNNIEYPATLITISDHDDHAMPAHFYKFAATAQEKQSGNNPILIRIEKNLGYGLGTPLTKSLNKSSDIVSFTLYSMGVEYSTKE